MNAADCLTPINREALRLLEDGLCCIREAALRSPEQAMKIADALHNIPGLIAGEDRAGEAYLVELLKQGQGLVNDHRSRKF